MLDLQIGSVLEQISNMGVVLPEEGFLSGQGFVSLLLRENNFNKYKSFKQDLIVNDIDVFDINYFKTHCKYDYAGGTNICQKQFLTGYQTILLHYKDTFKFLNSYKKGLLNITNYGCKYTFSDNNNFVRNCIDSETQTFNSSYANFNDKSFFEDTYFKIITKLIECFDMNNVQVLYDLKYKKIIYTPAFEDFFHTGELKIISFHSPENSLLRAIKKSEEQGYYFNLDFFVKKCYFLSNSAKKFSFISELSTIKHNSIIRNLSSYFELDFIEDVSSYFLHYGVTSYNYNNFRSNLYKLKSVNSELDSFLKDIMFYYDEIFCFHNDFKQASVLFDLFYSKKHILDKHIKYLNKHKKEPSKEKYIYYPLRFTKDPTSLGYRKMLIESNLENLNLPYHYFDSCFKLVKNHEELHPIFVGINLEELIDRYNIIQLAIKEFGLFIIPFVKEFFDINSNSTLLYSFIKEKVDIIKNEEPLKQPFFAPFNYKDYTVKELTTNLELFIEGQEQHHCVGGYGYNVKNNRSFIFSFKHSSNPNLNLTAEVCPIYLLESVTKDKICYSAYSPYYWLRLNQLYFHHNNSVPEELYSEIRDLLYSTINSNFNFFSFDKNFYNSKDYLLNNNSDFFSNNDDKFYRDTVDHDTYNDLNKEICKHLEDSLDSYLSLSDDLEKINFIKEKEIFIDISEIVPALVDDEEEIPF